MGIVIHQAFAYFRQAPVLLAASVYTNKYIGK